MTIKGSIGNSKQLHYLIRGQAFDTQAYAPVRTSVADGSMSHYDSIQQEFEYHLAAHQTMLSKQRQLNSYKDKHFYHSLDE